MFNKLDLPIRFIYSQLNLNKFLFWKLYASSFEQLDKSFEEMKALVSAANYSFDNKVCLELGPGNSYISAYNFLLHGAKKVILVDKYPRYLSGKKQEDYLKKELDYISKKYNKPLFFIENNKVDSHIY